MGLTEGFRREVFSRLVDSMERREQPQDWRTVPITLIPKKKASVLVKKKRDIAVLSQLLQATERLIKRPFVECGSYSA